MVLDRDPLCTVPGCNRASTDCAHIISRADGGDDDIDNLRGMCHAHHSQETAAKDGGFGNE